LEARPECCLSAVVVEKARCDHQFAYEARLQDRHLQLDRASIAESKNICLLDVEVVEKTRRVIGGPLEADLRTKKSSRTRHLS
jgi:hypothetical protein